MAIDYLAMLKQKQQEAEKASKEQKTSTGTTKPKKEEKPKKAPKEEYTYPFSMYTEGRTVDISAYGFEDNKEYTPKEICDIMLQHRHYEFAGEMSFKLFKDDNMLVATSKQYKKG